MTFPLPGANWSILHSLRLVASTGVGGFALQNGTPTILSWTAPNDGNLHRVICPAMLNVTAPETGGEIDINATLPNNAPLTATLIAGGQAAGIFTSGGPQFWQVMVKPGTTVSVTQLALTAGAAVLWAEIWAL